jgi:hypothetical protein
LEKKDEKRIHVDMNAKLSSVSFVGITSFVTFERHIYYTLVVSPGLDPSLWPASKEVDHMAGEVAKARKNGMAKCFVFADLRSNFIFLLIRIEQMFVA